MREGGFEPPKALSTTALEAVPFDHSGTPADIDYMNSVYF